jgi:hypothetical protein
MDPNWNELKNELAAGPFPENGFSKQLQRQIVQKLDGQLSTSKTRMLRTAGAWLFILLLFTFISLNWTPLTETVGSIEESAGQVNNLKAVNDHNQIIDKEQSPVKSVLLIGLRTDFQTKNEKRVLSGNYYSEYRSLMITGDVKNPTKLEVAAEGSGILIPYRQDFWKITPITLETKNDTYHYLSAYKAKEVAIQRKYEDTPDQEIRHNEKLVFAGNQYVSIVENDEEWRGNAPANYEKIWTRTLEQMNSPTDQTQKSITLEQIFNNQAVEAITQLQSQMQAPQSAIKDEITGENWTITRSKGRWIPQIAETHAFTNNHATSYTLHSLAFSLPESVVSYDQLTCSWEQIIEAQPEAVDAVSSPYGDMIAILTASKLYAYTLVNNQIGPLALQVDLHQNEALVMAQWASAKYADNWVKEGKSYLNYE